MSILQRLFRGPKPAAAAPGVPEPSWINPWGLGLRDAIFGGWFRPNGELFEGFRISADDIVLDAGCGSAGHASYCALQGAHVIFADVDPATVAAAERRLTGSNARGLTPLVTDCNPLPLEDDAVTRIVSTEMLEHVDDPSAVLRELVRVGRPGALYLMSVPDPVSEEIQKRLFPQRYTAVTGHVRIFQRDGFAKLVTDAGLTIQAQRLDSFFWSMWFILFLNSDIDIAVPFLNSGVDLSSARHPTLDNWTQTWEALLNTPEGAGVKAALDAVMPKSQIIVARKP